MIIKKAIPLRERIYRGEVVFGVSLTFPCPSVVELSKKAGYDFVRLDLEHSLMSAEEVRSILMTARLAQMPCQVRTPDMVNLTALLSQEPSAIMIPHVENVEDAQAAINACKFAPVGRRGMDGNTRMMRAGGMNRAEYIAYQQTALDLIIQIESRQGLGHIDEIIALEGIDMAATGRADLSQELGVPGQKDHPEVIAAENMIIRKALKHKKIPCIAADSRKRVQELYDMGVRLFVIGKDEPLLERALKEQRKMFWSPEIDE